MAMDPNELNMRFRVEGSEAIDMVQNFKTVLDAAAASVLHFNEAVGTASSGATSAFNAQSAAALAAASAAQQAAQATASAAAAAAQSVLQLTQQQADASARASAAAQASATARANVETELQRVIAETIGRSTQAMEEANARILQSDQLTSRQRAQLAQETANLIAQAQLSGQQAVDRAAGQGSTAQLRASLAAEQAMERAAAQITNLGQRAEAGLGQANTAFVSLGFAAQALPGPIGEAANAFGMLTLKISQSQAEMLGFAAGMTAISEKMGQGIAGWAHAAGDFEAAMAQVRITSNASTDDLARFTAAAMDLGQRTSFSSKQIAAGFYELTSAGLTVNQSLQAIEPVTQFAMVSNQQLGETTKNVVTTMRQFGLEAKDIPHILDVQATAVQGSILHWDDLGNAYKGIAGRAHTMGDDVETATAAVMLMTNAGLTASMAGTALGTFYDRLIKQTGEAKEGARQLGLELYNENGQFVGMSSVLHQVENASVGATQQWINQAESLLSGMRASGFLRNALSQQQEVERDGQLVTLKGAELFDFWADKLRGVTNVVQAQAIVVLATWNKQLEILNASVAEAAITLGMQLLPALEAITPMATAVVNAFIAMPAPMKAAVDAVAVVDTALIGLLGTFTLLRTIAPVVGTAMGDALAAMGIVGGLGALVVPLGLLTAAVATLAVAYSTNFLQIRDITNEVAATVQDDVARIANAIETQLKPALAGLGSYAGSEFSQLGTAVRAQLGDTALDQFFAQLGQNWVHAAATGMMSAIPALAGLNLLSQLLPKPAVNADAEETGKEAGAAMGKGVGEGLNASAGNVQATVSALLQEAKGNYLKAINTAAGVGDQQSVEMLLREEAQIKAVEQAIKGLDAARQAELLVALRQAQAHGDAAQILKVLENAYQSGILSSKQYADALNGVTEGHSKAKTAAQEHSAAIREQLGSEDAATVALGLQAQALDQLIDKEGKLIPAIQAQMLALKNAGDDMGAAAVLARALGLSLDTIVEAAHGNAAAITLVDRATAQLSESHKAMAAGAQAAKNEIKDLTASTSAYSVAQGIVGQQLDSFVKGALREVPLQLQAAVTAQGNANGAFAAATTLANGLGVSYQTVVAAAGGVPDALLRIHQAQLSLAISGSNVVEIQKIQKQVLTDLKDSLLATNVAQGLFLDQQNHYVNGLLKDVPVAIQAEVQALKNAGLETESVMQLADDLGVSYEQVIAASRGNEDAQLALKVALFDVADAAGQAGLAHKLYQQILSDAKASTDLAIISQAIYESRLEQFATGTLSKLTIAQAAQVQQQINLSQSYKAAEAAAAAEGIPMQTVLNAINGDTTASKALSEARKGQTTATEASTRANAQHAGSLQGSVGAGNAATASTRAHTQATHEHTTALQANTTALQANIREQIDYTNYPGDKALDMVNSPLFMRTMQVNAQGGGEVPSGPGGFFTSDRLSQILGSTPQAQQAATNNAAYAIQQSQAKIEDQFTPAWDEARGYANKIAAGLASETSAVTAAATALGKAATQPAIDTLGTQADAARTAATDFGQAIQDGIAAGSAGAPAEAAAAVDATTSAAETALAAAVAPMEAAAQEIAAAAEPNWEEGVTAVEAANTLYWQKIDDINTQNAAEAEAQAQAAAQAFTDASVPPPLDPDKVAEIVQGFGATLSAAFRGEDNDKAIREAAETLSSTLDGALLTEDDAKSIADRYAHALSANLTDQAPVVAQTAKEQLAAAQAAAKDAAGPAGQEVGRSLTDGIVQGLKGAATSLLSTASGVVDDIVAAMKKKAGITSPSTLMAQEVGLPLVQGIGAGFEQGLPALFASVGTAMDSLAGHALQTGLATMLNESPPKPEPEPQPLLQSMDVDKHGDPYSNKMDRIVAAMTAQGASNDEIFRTLVQYVDNVVVRPPTSDEIPPGPENPAPYGPIPPPTAEDTGTLRLLSHSVQQLSDTVEQVYQRTAPGMEAAGIAAADRSGMGNYSLVAIEQVVSTMAELAAYARLVPGMPLFQQPPLPPRDYTSYIPGAGALGPGAQPTSDQERQFTDFMLGLPRISDREIAANLERLRINSDIEMRHIMVNPFTGRPDQAPNVIYDTPYAQAHPYPAGTGFNSLYNQISSEIWAQAEAEYNRHPGKGAGFLGLSSEGLDAETRFQMSNYAYSHYPGGGAQGQIDTARALMSQSGLSEQAALQLVMATGPSGLYRPQVGTNALDLVGQAYQNSLGYQQRGATGMSPAELAQYTALTGDSTSQFFRNMQTAFHQVSDLAQALPDPFRLMTAQIQGMPANLRPGLQSLSDVLRQTASDTGQTFDAVVRNFNVVRDDAGAIQQIFDSSGVDLTANFQAISSDLGDAASAFNGVVQPVTQAFDTFQQYATDFSQLQAPAWLTEGLGSTGGLTSLSPPQPSGGNPQSSPVGATGMYGPRIVGDPGSGMYYTPDPNAWVRLPGEPTLAQRYRIPTYQATDDTFGMPILTNQAGHEIEYSAYIQQMMAGMQTPVIGDQQLAGMIAQANYAGPTGAAQADAALDAFKKSQQQHFTGGSIGTSGSGLAQVPVYPVMIGGAVQSIITRETDDPIEKMRVYIATEQAALPAQAKALADGVSYAALAWSSIQQQSVAFGSQFAAYQAKTLESAAQVSNAVGSVAGSYIQTVAGASGGLASGPRSVQNGATGPSQLDVLLANIKGQIGTLGSDFGATAGATADIMNQAGRYGEAIQAAQLEQNAANAEVTRLKSLLDSYGGHLENAGDVLAALSAAEQRAAAAADHLGSVQIDVANKTTTAVGPTANPIDIYNAQHPDVFKPTGTTYTSGGGSVGLPPTQPQGVPQVGPDGVTLGTYYLGVFYPADQYPLIPASSPPPPAPVAPAPPPEPTPIAPLPPPTTTGTTASASAASGPSITLGSAQEYLGAVLTTIPTNYQPVGDGIYYDVSAQTFANPNTGAYVKAAPNTSPAMSNYGIPYSAATLDQVKAFLGVGLTQRPALPPSTTGTTTTTLAPPPPPPPPIDWTNMTDTQKYGSPPSGLGTLPPPPPPIDWSKLTDTEKYGSPPNGWYGPPVQLGPNGGLPDNRVIPFNPLLTNQHESNWVPYQDLWPPLGNEADWGGHDMAPLKQDSLALPSRASRSRAVVAVPEIHVHAHVDAPAGSSLTDLQLQDTARRMLPYLLSLMRDLGVQ